MSNVKKPLLSYSEHLERAEVFDIHNENKQMPAKRRTKRAKSSGRKSRGRKRLLKGGHKLIHGKIKLKLKGYGTQTVNACQLVRFVPLSKLKTAARKVLSRSP